MHESAQQFESLLIGKMLQSARESAGSSFAGMETDSSSSSLFEFAEQQLAQLLSAQGGLGIARLIEQHVSRDQNPTPAAGTKAASAILKL